MRKKDLLILLFLITNLFVTNCLGQHLFFEKISGQEIDPSTSIHGIAKDSVGYIWFGSWNGVYRYDGKAFDYYYHNPKDKLSLPNNRIRNIVSDNKLGLWFLTFDHKYARFNYALNNFKIISSEAVPSKIISSLNADSNALNRDKIINGKYYSLDTHLFSSFDLKSRKEIQYKANMNQPGSLLDDYITTFFIDDEKIIWLGTRGGDIYKANPNRNPFELHYSYVGNSENTKLATVRAILKVGNQIWLGSDEGVLIYQNNQLIKNHPFYHSNSKIQQVRTLFQDKNGGIWIGGVNGLEYYNPKNNQIRSIINEDLSPNLETWSVYAIEPYNENVIWLGLYNAIARIDLSNFKIVYYNLTNEIKDRTVMDIICDKNKLWLGTEGNGVVQLTLNSHLDLIKNNSLTLLNNDTFNNGNFLANIVYSLNKDKKGYIWVGTSEGLFKINPKKKPIQIVNVPLRIKSPYTYISAITDDNKGNLWVAHKEGISKINIESGEISNFQNRDKLGSWRFLERSFYNDKINNTIYFGSKNGYVSFNSEKIKAISNDKKIVLKSLFVANQKVEPLDTIWGKPILTKTLSETQSIELDYENRSFEVEFSSFNYYDTRKEVFEYMLEGYDDNWTQTSSTKIAFNKIPAGSYVLKVRLITPDISKAPVAQLHVEVKALWYERWWVRLLLLGGLFALLYWIFKQILYRDRLKNEVEMERLNSVQKEALNKEKIEFFTNISHDLKTPLTLIVDPLKRLQDDKVAPEDKAVYFSIVNRNIDYLTKLIYQILDFRKSEIGKLKLHLTSRSFNEFLDDCYKSFLFISQKRNISLEFLPENHNLVCSLDFEKLEQVVTNLLSNAFKYTPDGGKVILSTHLNLEKSKLTIKIEDNGIGIEASQLEKIFEPFNNVGPSPYYGYSSGIGLSLSRNLIELMQGTISIESFPQNGTRVQIDLPYVAVQETNVFDDSDKETNIGTAISENEIETIVIESSKPTLLLVEDNPDVQMYLNKELGKTYHLIQEYDGKKGLEAAEKFIPDIIISDIMMPEMEGTELCKLLKKNEKTCHIPIILLTAKGADESKIEAYNLGAEAYVMKPFNVDVLSAQIKSVLENRIILQNKLAGIKEIKQLQEEIQDQDNEFLEKIMGIIKTRMEEPDFNSEELAQSLMISQRQLYRKLKGITGSTVHEFITKVKMNQAEELLRNSDLSISQIAYKLGFSEPSNFSRTFSKHFGCSPSQYLK
ncbi:hybrid sensor histidine kinase/response regulator transcription factor [Flavobacterium flavipallidum]|uniref:histidine kinase n=1 Tax=Flavobacterium flavipallidum TaxID=3139140 RepID=A0ABU9HRN2_9FLAO